VASEEGAAEPYRGLHEASFALFLALFSLRGGPTQSVCVCPLAFEFPSQPTATSSSSFHRQNGASRHDGGCGQKEVSALSLAFLAVEALHDAASRANVAHLLISPQLARPRHTSATRDLGPPHSLVGCAASVLAVAIRGNSSALRLSAEYILEHFLLAAATAAVAANTVQSAAVGRYGETARSGTQVPVPPAPLLRQDDEVEEVVHAARRRRRARETRRRGE